MEERNKTQEKQTATAEKRAKDEEKNFQTWKKANHSTEAIADRLAQKSFLGRVGLGSTLSKGAVKELKEADKRAKAKLQAEENAKVAPKPETPASDKH
jgi:hypothetical protein